MLYYAYGSNLNKKQMEKLCADSRPKFVATLPNYKLVFTGWSRTRRGGVATIKSFRGEKVRGAVYEVSEACLRKLDRWEAGYNRFNVTVYGEDNQPHQTVTYIKSGQLDETPPSKEYGEVIRQGYRDWGIV
jgi:gamma-glutamylcyclotransferase